MHRFLVVDDHEMTRYGVSLLLSQHFKPVQIDEAVIGADVTPLVKEHNYDLILLDMNLPDTDVHQLIDTVLELKPDVRILVFSMNKEEVFAKRLLSQGVKGYIEKSADKDEFLFAINTVLKDHIYLSQHLKTGIISTRKEFVINNPFQALSNKELEVMTHIIKGFGINQTAAIMNLSSSTVATHKARILTKLGLKNIYELIDLARLHKVL